MGRQNCQRFCCKSKLSVEVCPCVCGTFAGIPCLYFSRHSSRQLRREDVSKPHRRAAKHHRRGVVAIVLILGRSELEKPSFELRAPVDRDVEGGGSSGWDAGISEYWHPSGIITLSLSEAHLRLCDAKDGYRWMRQHSRAPRASAGSHDNQRGHDWPRLYQQPYADLCFACSHSSQTRLCAKGEQCCELFPGRSRITCSG